MARKKKYRKPRRPLANTPQLANWQFPSHIPTVDYIGDRRLDDPLELEEILGDFIYDFQSDYFLQWEAVVCREQGLPLTQSQRQAISEIRYTHDHKHKTILYIDENPRPDKPWYQILRTFVPYMHLATYKTDEIYNDVFLDGWIDLCECLEDEYSRQLSLPQDVKKPLDLIPEKLRHQLWLQACCGQLYGIGQEPQWSLRTEADRIDDFIRNLRRCRKSILFLQLTLENLLEWLILPEQERELFTQGMKQRLHLSDKDPIAVALQ